MLVDEDDVPARRHVDEGLQALGRGECAPVQDGCRVAFPDQGIGRVVGRRDHQTQSFPISADRKRVGVVVAVAGGARSHLDIAAQGIGQLFRRMAHHAPQRQLGPVVAGDVRDRLVGVVDALVVVLSDHWKFQFVQK